MNTTGSLNRQAVSMSMPLKPKANRRSGRSPAYRGSKLSPRWRRALQYQRSHKSQRRCGAGFIRVDNLARDVHGAGAIGDDDSILRNEISDLAMDAIIAHGHRIGVQH